MAPPAAPRRSTITGVTSPTDVGGGAATGLAAVLVSGAAVGVSAATGSWQPEGDRAVAWGLAFGAYVLVYVALSELVSRRPLLPERAGALVLLAAGLAVWFLDPTLTWMATLFVVTAGTWTSLFSRGVVTTLVVLQSVAVALGMVLTAADGAAVLALTGAFASFQAFAVVVIRGAERERAARAELDDAHRRLRATHEELRTAHAELRAATALLSAASRDAERLRIARDLHDGVGHQLTALALELEIAGHRGAGDGAHHVTRARDIAKGLLTEVRDTVSALRDEPQQLADTLRELLGELPGLAVGLEVAVAEPPGQDVALAVGRAVQEIATNTLRHSGAHRLDVAVTQDDAGTLTVHARDDGRGAPVVVPGNGLHGMAERVRALGGYVAVESGPGEGFAVTVRLPRTAATPLGPRALTIERRPGARHPNPAEPAQPGMPEPAPDGTPERPVEPAP